MDPARLLGGGEGEGEQAASAPRPWRRAAALALVAAATVGCGAAAWAWAWASGAEPWEGALAAGEPAYGALASPDELRGIVLGSGDQALSAFRAWKLAHGKQYASDAEEERRLANFVASAQRALAHNAPLSAAGSASGAASTYWLGLTVFADLTDDEFMERFALRSKTLGEACYESVRRGRERRAAQAQLAAGEGAAPGSTSSSSSSSSSPPSSVPRGVPPERMDWRERGIVTPVRDQGHCGSCWAHAAVGAMESLHIKKTGRVAILSEQQLVDCSRAWGNNGCAGGWPASAMEYVAQAGGIDSDRAYPYQAADGACHFRRLATAARVRGAANVTEYDEGELTRALGLVGPVAVAFEVTPDFRLYAGGVYSSAECGKDPHDLNHAVLAVGYGIDTSGVEYFVVKNSWSTRWGESGYFRMRKGSNECGIATCASYPLM